MCMSTGSTGLSARFSGSVSTAAAGCTSTGFVAGRETKASEDSSGGFSPSRETVAVFAVRAEAGAAGTERPDPCERGGSEVFGGTVRGGSQLAGSFPHRCSRLATSDAVASRPRQRGSATSIRAHRVQDAGAVGRRVWTESGSRGTKIGGAPPNFEIQLPGGRTA